jgi:uncharacterized protein (TIGR02588 family)
MMTPEPEKPMPPESTGQASPWEWASGAVSTVLVAGIAGFMIRQGIAQRDGMPHITVRADSIVQVGDQYRVEFSATNEGDATAAGLHVEGELRGDAGPVETSDVDIDYVPAGARRRAVLWFTQDPRTLHLQIRPTGNDLP